MYNKDTCLQFDIRQIAKACKSNKIINLLAILRLKITNQISNNLCSFHISFFLKCGCNIIDHTILDKLKLKSVDFIVLSNMPVS